VNNVAKQGRNRKKRFIELHELGKNSRDIAKEVRMSFGDIGSIKRRHCGEEKVETRKEEGSAASSKLLSVYA
jgi:hypothetical protein